MPKGPLFVYIQYRWAPLSIDTIYDTPPSAQILCCNIEKNLLRRLDSKFLYLMTNEYVNQFYVFSYFIYHRKYIFSINMQILCNFHELLFHLPKGGSIIWIGSPTNSHNLKIIIENSLFFEYCRSIKVRKFQKYFFFSHFVF